MRNFLLIPFLKLLIAASKTSRLGAGSTWPGHIMLGVSPSFIKQFDKKFTGKVIVIAGTNGKTTTSKMIRTILEDNGQKVIHNEAGANLLNGVASAIINASWRRKIPDVAVFEVDEYTLPLLLKAVTPDILVLLNLFRDQLDRYGEIDSIVRKWQGTLVKLPKETQLILNGDDPHVAYLGKDRPQEIFFFGIEDSKLYRKTVQHAMDTIYCPNCGKRLTFEGIYFAHLGKWRCESCGFARPQLAKAESKDILSGLYNLYNTKAAILAAKALGVKKDGIDRGLSHFTPAFGRQETFAIDGKKVKILLSKNPAGFNESLRTVKDLGAKYLLLVLNDRIPDGRDVSWIWDVDFEDYLESFDHITIGGDRCYDMALRIKYANPSKVKSEKLKVKSDNAKFKIHENLKTAIDQALGQTSKEETLYILPTYSAMLEVRKILGGRKIL